MMLFVSVLLALVPLLGIVWIVMYGSITSVDGLFMSLILLAMSGIVGLNVLIEKKQTPAQQSFPDFYLTASGGLVQRGRVESVRVLRSGWASPINLL